MTTTSGLPAFSTSGRTPVRALPGMKWAFSIPLRLGVALGVGDRLGDDLQPPDLAGAAGHRQPDRADPAVEVEEPLAAAQPGELGGDRVEALGHLGVGLEEGAVGDLQLAARRAPRAGAPRRARRSARRCRPSRPRSPCGGRPGAWRSWAGGGDEPGLDLAGAPALADDEVAQDALALAPVVGGDRSPAAPSRGPRCGRRCRPRRRAGSPRRRRSGPSGRGRGSRGSARRRPRRRSTRACCGSATARRPGRSPPARSRRGRRSAQRLVDLLAACGRAGARRGGPARARPGRARLRGRSGRRRGRPPASAARRSSPRRSGASSSSPPPARGRRAGRRRRRRRGRRRARRPARRRRASRSRARAAPTSQFLAAGAAWCRLRTGFARRPLCAPA